MKNLILYLAICGTIFTANSMNQIFDSSDQESVTDDLTILDTNIARTKYSYSGILNIEDGTQKITANSFLFRNNITEIIMPDSVTIVCDSAFETFNDKLLKKVKLSNNLEMIGDRCFRGRLGLKEITIPRSIKYIGAWAFEDTYLEKLTVPDTIIFKFFTGAYDSLKKCYCLDVYVNIWNEISPDARIMTISPGQKLTIEKTEEDGTSIACKTFDCYSKPSIF